MADESDRRPCGDVEAAAEAFEQAPVLMVVTDGLELSTLALNAAARAIVGGRFEPGQPILESFPRELQGQGWPQAYRTPVETGETVTVEEFRMQLHQPDGSVAQIYLDATFSPRLGPDGRPRGTIMTARDVTERVGQRAERQRELEELRGRYAAARGSVRALQRALLPDAVPVARGLDVAARYLLADDEDVAGGDWFDAVARPDGTTALVVGDVVGHGQAAAVAMGQLRTLLLAQLQQGAGLAESLGFLDRFADTVPAARRATVVVALVALVAVDGSVEYCTAGHPPPLVLAAVDGSGSRYLPPSGAGPLATGTVFTVARVQLVVGETLVLYSDGLLERPGTTGAAAAVELLSTADDAQHNRTMPAGAPTSAAERICSLVLELLTRTTGRSDDITILAAQRRAPVEDLAVGGLPGAAAAGLARRAVRSWLEDLAVDQETVQALLQSVTELVANVADHAHLDSPPQPLRLRAELTSTSQVVLRVSDSGSWKMPIVTESRGRGLALVRQLVDELQVEGTAAGTTATVRHVVHRPAGLLTSAEGPRPSARVDPEHFDVYATGGPEPVVTIVGPLDGTHTSEVSVYLNLALTEAATTATVDLTRLTLLASCGVDQLFRVDRQARALNLRLQLIAPNGTPAQHVLELVRLPYQQAPNPTGADAEGR
ncbi:SpoIIE family protein phosphatase [Microlunatus capsulatus]|uniref:Serine phosphatase RsbU (Regulator of sigma subunit)/anti-sigma regulatory factor (Ser/Thr protein kinase)/anti-anti-sigma regulatory factor n=1 Tax=Microlunatus capsulatus TaxID=99117 RepID=A0ABS4Z7K3_9ACTN|nr:SpoIIE family protein phosphatase [Microlunatus capsulatus]MBP2417025.1 serine phosphatase RsbU (regulator of sigma subunit)/anti-sigma regulatory factor (Ser/Thr protein kinase)/anti-anti-sigma regulatory factor [Microlunatus capsulatus]